MCFLVINKAKTIINLPNSDTYNGVSYWIWEVCILYFFNQVLLNKITDLELNKCAVYLNHLVSACITGASNLTY